MNTPDDPAPHGREPVDETLTTAELAGTTAPSHERAVEPRTFAEERPAEAPAAAATPTPLFPEGEADDLRGRWDTVQAGFVDEPRESAGPRQNAEERNFRQRHG